MAKVFERFESHTLGSRHRGVGLGLAIVRSFVELHGGRVELDSAPGRGTTVTCIFPAERRPPASRGRVRGRRNGGPRTTPTKRRRGRRRAMDRRPRRRGRDRRASRCFVAGELRPGDVVALSGDLGAGKTTFARSAHPRPGRRSALEVPSPTFTLMQAYDTPRGRIVHADLYRIGSADELAELGWDEAAEDALVLVEWPERAGDALAADRLDIALELAGRRRRGHRIAVLDGGTARWAAPRRRARRSAARCSTSGWRDATRARAGRRLDPRL